MKIPGKIVAVIGLLVVLFLAATPRFVHRFRRWRMEHAAISMPGPRFVVSDVFGQPVDFSKPGNRIVLLQLWATWCAYCRAEIPELIRLQEKYQSRDFEIVAISVDQDPELVRNFYQRYKLNYPVVMVDEKVARFFATALGIPEENVSSGTPVPTSVVIGRDGRISNIYIGRDVRVFEAALLQRLAPDPPVQVLSRQ